ncbi:pumilio homology domain family member 4 [Anaeramoeba flamelloides]|uniref:Pumilio homology domain family member 4 n=1 Tax=Anaeramoeba flamelloides TaxID=1746091 RepID=A0ABQ8YRB2_9EUKA|nr:pumilio homology domain family member 4 [Anaeramoeba flamelloides]
MTNQTPTNQSAIISSKRLLTLSTQDILFGKSENFKKESNQQENNDQLPKRRIRTSPSYESLSGGTDFDLYRNSTSNISFFNHKNLFPFDLSYSGSYSQKYGKPPIISYDPLTKNGTEQSMTRSTSLSSLLPTKMSNLKSNFQNMNLEKKPKNQNHLRVKKKSILRVRSFDHIPKKQQKLLNKSQTAHDLRLHPSTLPEKDFSANKEFQKSILSKTINTQQQQQQQQQQYINEQQQNFTQTQNKPQIQNKQQSINPNVYQYQTTNYDYNQNFINQNYSNQNQINQYNNNTNYQQSYNNEYQQQGYSPINEHIGNIYKISQNQYGCRFLQDMLYLNDPNVIAIIFNELLTNFHELMKDQFGNYLCQKLFLSCTDKQIYEVLKEIQLLIIPISTNIYGTRAIQKLIDCITTKQQQDLFFNSISINLIGLINNGNGNHVIQKCFLHFPHQRNQLIFQAIIDNFMMIACHKHGCCVMQRCIDFTPKVYRDKLTDLIIGNCLKLIQNPFANYVIQYMLNTDIRADEITKSIQGKMIQLSTHKFSSNVLEKCLRVANEKTRKILIDEFIENPESMKSLLLDPFANYVIQTSIKLSTNSQYQKFVNIIRPLIPYLKNSPCYKKIQLLVNNNNNEKNVVNSNKTNLNNNSNNYNNNSNNSNNNLNNTNINFHNNNNMHFKNRNKQNEKNNNYFSNVQNFKMNKQKNRYQEPNYHRKQRGGGYSNKNNTFN